MILRNFFSFIEKMIPVGRVALIPFNTSIFFRTIDPYIRLLKFLEKSRFFRGAVLLMNTPGGDAGASEILYHQVKSLSNRKPVYAYAIFATSGGYMVSCGARKIYSPKTGTVGSIGVILNRLILKDLFKKAGLKFDIYKKGKHKDLFLFHRESTPEERRKLDAFVNDAYESFLEIVSRERKIPLNKLKEIATGEVFSASKAKKLRLIDDIKTLDETIEEITKEVNLRPDQYILLYPPYPFLSRIISGAADALYERIAFEFLL